MVSSLQSLGKALQNIADAEAGEKENGEIFGTKPLRWWNDPHWRCPNEHVSTVLYRSELMGRVCMFCGKPVWLTFPEDVDGVLVLPVSEVLWTYHEEGKIEK